MSKKTRKQKTISYIVLLILIVVLTGGCENLSVKKNENGEILNSDVNEITYPDVKNKGDFSTAVNTQEKYYNEEDILGLSINVGIGNDSYFLRYDDINKGNFNNFENVKEIIFMNKYEANTYTYNQLQKSLEDFVKDINTNSYKYRAKIDNNFPIGKYEVYDKIYLKNTYNKLFKEGKIVLIYEKGQVEYLGSTMNNIINIGKFESDTKYNRSVHQITKHEGLHGLGLEHNLSKSDRTVKELPVFNKINIMTYDFSTFQNNPDDIKIVEMLSTQNKMAKRLKEKTIFFDTPVDFTKSETDKKYFMPFLVVSIRGIEKYNTYVGRTCYFNDISKQFPDFFERNVRNVMGLKVKTTMGNNDNADIKAFHYFMLNKVGSDVIDRMFKENKPLPEIIDYAEKYFAVEKLPAIDLYLEGVLAKKGIITKAEYDERIMLKYTRKMTSAKDIFGSLKEMLKNKTVKVGGAVYNVMDKDFVKVLSKETAKIEAENAVKQNAIKAEYAVKLNKAKADLAVAQKQLDDLNSQLGKGNDDNLWVKIGAVKETIRDKEREVANFEKKIQE